MRYCVSCSNRIAHDDILRGADFIFYYLCFSMHFDRFRWSRHCMAEGVRMAILLSILWLWDNKHLPYLVMLFHVVVARPFFKKNVLFQETVSMRLNIKLMLISSLTPCSILFNMILQHSMFFNRTSNFVKLDTVMTRFNVINFIQILHQLRWFCGCLFWWGKSTYLPLIYLTNWPLGLVHIKENTHFTHVRSIPQVTLEITKWFFLLARNQNFLQLKDDPRSLFNCWNVLKKVHDHCVKFKFGRITTMDISPRLSGQLKCTGNGKYLVKKITQKLGAYL